MVANIIVAVACNLIAAFVLIVGIVKGVSEGFGITFTKFILTAASVVGTYFLTPVLTGFIWEIEGFQTILTSVGVSVASVNACVFLIVFLVSYAVTSGVCAIIRAIKVAKFRKQHVNKIKLKRAKSINPKGEAAVMKAEKREAVTRYRASVSGASKFFGAILGATVALVLGFAILMPFTFIGKDVDAKFNTPYLVDGFAYTLNGLAGQEVAEKIVKTEWVSCVETTPESPEQPVTE